RRRPLCSDARHAATRHLHEVRGGQPEHGLGVARRGPDLVPLEEVLVDHGREGPGGADGCDAADREPRAGADEGGVRLLDRLVDELRDALLVHAVRSARRHEDRPVGAPAPEHQRLHDLVHAAAERTGRVDRRPRGGVELDDAVATAERRQPFLNALEARRHRLASPAAAARTTTITGSPRLRPRLALPRSQARLACGCGSHYHDHRLASPAAAARTTTITGSPRLRLRLALPRSQARLACGCGSHYHDHRLASPAAAARTTTITGSPRL